MASPYFHPEEEFQVWELETFNVAHPGDALRVTFGDGETYLCVFDTAFDTDNTGDLGIDSSSPLFDEFHQVSLRVTAILHGGMRTYGEWLNLDYRDWPVEIISDATGEVVCPRARS